MEKNNIIAGYVVQSELKNVSLEDARSLDIINIAFGHCKDGKISFNNEIDLEYTKNIRAMNPKIKILLSVGGWGSGGFSPMAASGKSRLSFALSCLDFVKKHSLDGIDIDWEYPCIDWANIEASPDDKHNFTLMLAQIREGFDNSGIPSLMLTIAVGNDRYFIDNTEMDKVQKYLDYVSIMTYDMRGCGDSFTGHHTNIFPYDDAVAHRGIRSVLHSVEIYSKAGVPLDKIVIGAAFYSRMWKNVKDNGSKHGLCCPAEPGNYGPGYGELKASFINKNGYIEYYDKTAGAPYLFNGSDFISYDNEHSIKEKCRFVKNYNLLGIMYWEHSCDSTRKLLKALKEGMRE